MEQLIIPGTQVDIYQDVASIAISKDTENLIINEAIQVGCMGLLSRFTLSEAIGALISSYRQAHNSYRTEYARYKAESDGTPIKTRKLPNFMKIDNHINNSFMSEIVDTKQGYMMGIPIVYEVTNQKLVEKEMSDEELIAEKFKYNKMSNKVKSFINKNNLHDINLETTKIAAICGTASRLVYVAGATDEVQADVRVVLVHPWETIFIYSPTSHLLLVAIRYYQQYVLESGVPRLRNKVEIYDKSNIYYYTETAINAMDVANMVDTSISYSNYVPDSTQPVNPRAHLMGGVPLFEYKNNEERQGDCAKIYELIDAYDRSVSDLSSELEQFRLAYLALYGLKSKPEEIEKLKQTGMFEMTKDGKLEFITKKLDIPGIMLYFNRLENNIVRFAKSVNFKDENFYGNLSGVAIRYKLMQLEEKAMTAQVKFEVADDYMWNLLQKVSSLRSVYFDSSLIKRQFTRNIPVNILEEARIQTELEGKVSTETRMSVASFIVNPSIEAQALEQERVKNKQKGIDFMKSDGTAVKITDVEAGGPIDRNTNGTIAEL